MINDDINEDMQDFDDEELDVDALVFIIGYILKMLV
jgi:hypothetical protein